MVTPFDRRDFLKMSAIGLAALLNDTSFLAGAHPSKLAFSTLGCPDWELNKVIEFARLNNYQGIEIRGIQRQLDLSKCPDFSTTANRKSSLQKMKDNDLKFVNLGSSCTLHFPAGAERMKNIDEGKRFIEIASDLHCPFIRVFPNNFPKDQDKEQTLDLISSGINELAQFAKGSSVEVLLETHGDLVKADDIVSLMKKVDRRGTGLIWDVTNMWTITNESPATVYPKIASYIKHTHIKDAYFDKGKWNYVLLGKGAVPIFEAIDLLRKDNYKGYYSFEWEKLWHPEIDAPELALADFPSAISNHISKK